MKRTLVGLMIVALAVFFFSFIIFELKDFRQLSFFVMLHSLALLPLSISHIESFIVRLFVSLIIFRLLLYFTRRTGIRKETAALPPILSLSALGVLLAATVVSLFYFKIDLTVMSWSLSLAIGLSIVLLRRDLFKVILGVYVAFNAAHGLFLGLVGPTMASLSFNLLELAIVGVMLWTTLLVYERYGSLDLRKTNLLRW